MGQLSMGSVHLNLEKGLNQIMKIDFENSDILKLFRIRQWFVIGFIRHIDFEDGWEFIFQVKPMKKRLSINPVTNN